MQPTKLKAVRPIISFLLASLVFVTGCGDSHEAGDNEGNPTVEQSSYRLTCTIDALVLEIPIELFFELDRPYSEDGSATMTFSAELTFSEQASAALAEAGVSKIDIVAVDVATSLTGASPQVLETSLDAAPINDFDLSIDPDDDGIPGPHRLELDAVARMTTVIDDADEVVLDMRLNQVSIILGDFHVPSDCLGPTLVGSAVRFST